jgi:hypothetical protein
MGDPRRSLAAQADFLGDILNTFFAAQNTQLRRQRTGVAILLVFRENKLDVVVYLFRVHTEIGFREFA